MKLSVSNIAWSSGEDIEIAKLLKSFEIDGVDIAPSKYFGRLDQASAEDIKRVRDFWRDAGFSIPGMQALLFGTTGLNVFGPPSCQQEMLGHLKQVARIGAGLGSKYLVFGSPKNRDRSGLSNAEALRTAKTFFKSLGDIAESFGVYFCLEPNPAIYGCNFMIDYSETSAFLEEVAHPNIRLQFDSGALQSSKEPFAQLKKDSLKWIAHAHASELNLTPISDRDLHHNCADFLQSNHAADWVCLEAKQATRDELVSSLKLFTGTYKVQPNRS